MTEMIKVHYLFEEANTHVPWQSAVELDNEKICQLARNLRSESDVIYLNPEWTSDRVVLWGIDGREIEVEFQKATEAMSYRRRDPIDHLLSILEDLSNIWNKPEENGFKAESF